MTRLEIEWPDESVERVRAAQGRLEVARPRLVEMSFDVRMQAVERVLEAWTAADSPWRRELVATLAPRSGFASETFAEGLESALRAWSPADLRTQCTREWNSIAQGQNQESAPFDSTAILAGGAIPMPTLLSGLLPLVAGSPVLLREPTRDRVTADLLKRSVDEIEPELAAAFESISFPHEDEAALRAFLEAPCIVATGSDDTIRQVRMHAPARSRLVEHGHRFSLAVLGPDALADESTRSDTAKCLALDIVRWDQLGCLSPVIAHTVGVPGERIRLFADALAESLDALADRLPRGEVPEAVRASHATQRAQARMRQAGDDAAALFEVRDACVVLESDATPRPAPLHRFFRILPVDDAHGLARALEPFRGQLSNCAVTGFPIAEGAPIEATLNHLGVSRIATPGTLQTPPIDWPHDGLPVLLSLTRWQIGA